MISILHSILSGRESYISLTPRKEGRRKMPYSETIYTKLLQHPDILAMSWCIPWSVTRPARARWEMQKGKLRASTAHQAPGSLLSEHVLLLKTSTSTIWCLLKIGDIAAYHLSDSTINRAIPYTPDALCKPVVALIMPRIFATYVQCLYLMDYVFTGTWKMQCCVSTAAGVVHRLSNVKTLTFLYHVVWDLLGLIVSFAEDGICKYVRGSFGQ